MKVFSCVFILLVWSNDCQAQWGYSQDQTEVWDVVDEFNGNFYEFLNVSPDSSSNEVRRAYRRLSLDMHPDKNKTEGAEENFRILVSIYEVLKNKEKREIYDEVLVNGIPRAYLYVPKQIRKMGLFEVAGIMTLFLTLGHFLFMWGAYFEKILVKDDFLERKKKKSMKKKNNPEQEIIIVIEKPKWKDILPIAMLRGIYYLVRIAPKVYKHQKEQARFEKERIEAEARAIEEAKEMEKEIKLKREQQKQERKERSRQNREKRMKMAAEESPKELKAVSAFDNSEMSLDDLDAFFEEELEKKKPKQSPWTPDDDALLVKLMTKYPRGTTDRWDVIAEEMRRFKTDVISRAKKSEKVVGMVKANQPAVKRSTKNLIPEDMDLSVRLEGNNETSQSIQNNPSNDNSQNNWTQEDQVLLEQALKLYPKKMEDNYDRWDLIATTIPSKSKKDCIARYKLIASNLKSKTKS